MMQIVKCIRFNNVYIPITMLLDEFQRQNIPVGDHRSIYRELLFLSFIALGKENVDHGKATFGVNLFLSTSFHDFHCQLDASNSNA